jgi:hypothetical protein
MSNMKNPFVNFANELGITPSDVGLRNTTLTSATLENVILFVFAVIGTISLIVVILGAIQYIISAGEPQKQPKQKTLYYTQSSVWLSV